jgi:hypothetical protein
LLRYDTVMSYIPPQNKAEYWALVDNCWNDIAYLLDTFLPSKSREYIDGSPLDKTLREHILELKAARNPKIARIFNEAYFRIPDDVQTSEIPSFEQFEDLCVFEYRLQGQ